MTKPYVCPRCFQPAPDTDARGACPACGYTDDGARLLLRLALAVFLVVLFVGALSVLWFLGLNS